MSDSHESVRISLPDGEMREVPKGTPVGSLAPPSDELTEKALVALLDYEPVDMRTPLEQDARVSFASLASPHGARAYRHGLKFLLSIAAAGCYPEERVMLEHSLGGCLYGKLQGRRVIDVHTVGRLCEEMRRLVESDLELEPVEVTKEQATLIFQRSGDYSKLKLLVEWPRETVRLYRCAGVYQFYPGPLVERTGLLRLFDLQSYPPGFILRLPDLRRKDQLGVTDNRPKLFRIFYENEQWGEVLGAETVGDLNEEAKLPTWDTLVHVAESLHENKIAAIAERILSRQPVPRVILISGPSSSGKTTFSRRLGIQLRVLGARPETLSLDNYFVDRDKTPRDENGEYDYEALEAIDVAQFNRDLNQLLEGRNVVLPRYDFKTGRSGPGRSLRLGKDSLLVIEGIHGLNDALTPVVWPHMKYKVYVSALTYLSVDDQNAISTSDVRLIRRIVRDCASRGYSAAETIARWPSVRAGEGKWIFPYQESADDMFNSALLYELHALRGPAEGALRTIPHDSPEYGEASRLLGLLELVRPVDSDIVPATSILREFLGGSAFRGVG